MDRRRFLQAGLIGAGLTGAHRLALALPGRDSGVQEGIPNSAWSQYEQVLARTRQLSFLGRPTSWSVVRQGFLPISPERVLILEPEESPWNKTPADRWAKADFDEKARLRERIARDGKVNCPDEQLGLILRITGELARYYAATGFWDDWAYRMACREWLGSTAFGNNAAVPHQFQVQGHIRTINRPVDWWLILFPQGINWNRPDDKPVHVMFTYIFSRPWQEWPHLSLGALGLLAGGLRSLAGQNKTAFVELSQMDRASAAQLVNHHVVMALRDEKRL